MNCKHKPLSDQGRTWDISPGSALSEYGIVAYPHMNIPLANEREREKRSTHLSLFTFLVQIYDEKTMHTIKEMREFSMWMSVIAWPVLDYGR